MNQRLHVPWDGPACILENRPEIKTQLFQDQGALKGDVNKYVEWSSQNKHVSMRLTKNMDLNGEEKYN